MRTKAKAPKMLVCGHEYDKRTFPAAMVADCTAPGQDADPMIRRWLRTKPFDADPDKARAYLKGFGAWDEEELQDHEANIRRLVWLACCDISEQGRWYFGI